MPWQVYLSGEIHTDWRERIVDGAEAAGLDVDFTGPVTDHAASDDCGAAILGAPSEKFWHDHVGAGVNAIRTRTLLEHAEWSSYASASSTASGTPPSTPATRPRWARRS
jgi:YtoQ family protein